VFLYDILKVIYSPVKAFREVLANPKYIGPIIIIIISLFLTLGMQYVSVSKHYVETIAPANRVDWTNSTNPSQIWTSNGSISAINATVYGVLVGDYAVRSFVDGTQGIWLKRTNIGTINCSEAGGFRTFYYKLGYTAFNQTPAVQNVSSAKLRLFSFNNESRYFEFDLLSGNRYLNKSGWTDVNITLTLESGWKQVNSSDWSSITGIEFKFDFPQNGLLTLILNDLYFGGKYELLYDAVGSSYWLSSTLIASVFDLFLRWLILAGMLWLTIKVFHAEGSQFKTLLIIVGYTFAIMFVYVPINMLIISQLPTLHFPYRVVFPASARETDLANIATSNIYATNWTFTPPYLAFIVISYISHAWTICLFTIALKILKDFSWKKAAVISLVAYVMAIVLTAVVGQLFSF
jgi:hypothetical protein